MCSNWARDSTVCAAWTACYVCTLNNTSVGSEWTEAELRDGWSEDRNGRNLAHRCEMHGRAVIRNYDIRLCNDGRSLW